MWSYLFMIGLCFSQAFLPPYTVHLHEEIPLKGFKGEEYQSMSLYITPTHCFTVSGTYIFKQPDPQTNKHSVYPLPAGYYRMKSCEIPTVKPFHAYMKIITDSVKTSRYIPYEYKGEEGPSAFSLCCIICKKCADSC